MPAPNEGIIVTGGSFHSEQTAVGRNAQVISTVYNIARDFEQVGQQEMASSLTALIQSLESHRGEIEDYEEVAQAVQMIAEEARKDMPNKLTLKSLLHAVQESVSSVADIVSKLGLLRKAIGLLI